MFCSYILLCFIYFQYVEASNLEIETLNSDATSYHKAWQTLCTSNGVVVPGGFGKRGMEGKIQACQWCREKNIPFLGDYSKFNSLKYNN